MTLLTHALGGACAIALLDTALPNYTADKIVYIVGAVVATLPDIDYSRSFIGRVFYPVARFFETVCGHRTLTHSFLFAILFSLLFGSLTAFFTDENYLRWSAILFIAYTSHFVLDWFTKEGAQSYWPAQVWCVIPRRRSWRATTGKAGELLFFVFLSGAFAVSFEPSREATYTWFRSSFVTEKTEEIQRFEIKKEQVTKGYTIEEIKALRKDKIISESEYQAMIYELQQIEINQNITKKMYGIPLTPEKVENLMKGNSSEHE